MNPILILLVAVAQVPPLAEPPVTWESMRPYRPTRWSQRLAITGNVETLLFRTHDQDEFFAMNFDEHKRDLGPRTIINPNREFPWAVPGGMHNLTGWRSELRMYLPGGTVTTWKQRVQVERSSPLPKWRWAFHDGTKFAERLSTNQGVFEARTMEKIAGKWKFSVAFRDLTKAPVGYTGPGKACIECHGKVGSGVSEYTTTRRGDDGVFSAPVLEWLGLVKE